MMPVVWFVDTSVLCEFLAVPGKCSQTEVIRARFAERRRAGDSFVLPVTAIIETGNHICHADGDRRRAAQDFVDLIRAVKMGAEGFALHEVAWDASFLAALADGGPTGQPFADLAGNRQMGAGDLAILIERQRFRERGAFRDVRVWTLDAGLAVYA